MITHDNIVTFLKNSLTTYLESPYDEQTGEPLGQYSDFVDNMEIYQESSYNSKKDIVITVQFLKGSTQVGVTDLPINVIFEVLEGKATHDKTMANEFMDLVNTFIEDYNDTTINMIDDNNTTYIVKQYYSSTTALGNGQQRGDKKYKAFSMDMRLIIYENNYFHALEDSKIKFNLATGVTKELENVLEIVTRITHGQEGFTLGANPNQQLRLNSIQYHLQVTYIATKKIDYFYLVKQVTSETFTTDGSLYTYSNNTYSAVTSGSYDSNTTYYERFINLHKKIAAEALEKKTYNITHEGFVTRNANMRVVDCVESTPYADVMKVQLTLARE